MCNVFSSILWRLHLHEMVAASGRLEGEDMQMDVKWAMDKIPPRSVDTRPTAGLPFCLFGSRLVFGIFWL
jgi:hypothetical protein